MGEELRVATGGRAAHEHAAEPVVPGRAREDLDGVQLAPRVRPVGALAACKRRGPCPPRAAAALARLLRRLGAALLGRQHRVGGLGPQEGQLGSDAARAGRAAEEPAQLSRREAVPPDAWFGHRGILERPSKAAAARRPCGRRRRRSGRGGAGRARRGWPGRRGASSRGGSTAARVARRGAGGRGPRAAQKAAGRGCG